MRKWKKQNGYILPMMLFFLACTMLWGSLLLLTLSDGYAASEELVRQEQSRLLAWSGWNMALQQLETSGSLESICINQEAGRAQVQLQETAENQISIQSEAYAGSVKKKVSGCVQLLEFPWSQVADWQIAESVETVQQPSIIVAKEDTFALDISCSYPLAISAGKETLQVTVPQPVTLDICYIHGDLLVEAPMVANAVCVSGHIIGAEQIESEQIMEENQGIAGYRVLVTEREV